MHLQCTGAQGSLMTLYQTLGILLLLTFCGSTMHPARLWWFLDYFFLLSVLARLIKRTQLFKDQIICHLESKASTDHHAFEAAMKTLETT